MNKSKFNEVGKLSTGIIGLLAVFAILTALNVILGNLRIRKDLTEEKLYSLSGGTKSILAKLEQPVTLKLFFSKSNPQVPVYLKNFADQVEDLLHEYRIAADDNVIIEEYDPRPDTDDEEWALRFGIAGQQLDMFSPPFYFGLAAVSGTSEATIPALDPRSEQLLEYNITRLIHRVVHPEKPGIGVISSLPVLGEENRFHMPNQPPPAQPWIAFRELRGDYVVNNVTSASDISNRRFDTLVLVHPKDLDNKMLYGIDQFVMKGGRLLVFLDPFCNTDLSRPQPGSFSPPNNSSDLAALLEAWGVGYDAGKLAADLRSASRIQTSAGVEESPIWLTMHPDNMSKDDILTSQLETIMMPLAGHFRDNTTEDLNFTPLLTTSDNAVTVDKQMIRFGIRGIRGQLNKPGEKLNLAVRISGRFKTAFPDGPPADEDEEDNEKSDEDGKEESPSPKGLQEGESSVILVGDVDMLADQYCVEELSFFGTTVPRPFNDNLNFFANSTEQMAGSAEMINIRSRGRFYRPFERVLALEEKARRMWHSREEELQTRLQQTQAKLNKLQQQKDKDQRLIMSDAQQREIADFRRELARIQKDLRDVRKNLRREIEALGTRIKLLNTALMPSLVCLAGICYAVYRRKKK